MKVYLRWFVILVPFLANSAFADEASDARAIAYLKKCQLANGAYKPYDQGMLRIYVAPTLGATSAAVRSLKYLGTHSENQEGAAKFVESCYDPNTGGFSDLPKGKPAVASTAIGLMAAAELKIPVEKFAAAEKFLDDNARSFEEIRIAVAGFEAINKRSSKEMAWTESVQKRRNPDGTFGKGAGLGRDTGGSVVALLRMGVKAEPKATLEVLNQSQRKSGGWGTEEMPDVSDLASSYRVLRCYWMLKAKPANPETLRDLIDRCQNRDGGFGNVPGEKSSVGNTYYAAIMRYWLKNLDKK